MFYFTLRHATTMEQWREVKIVGEHRERRQCKDIRNGKYSIEYPLI